MSWGRGLLAIALGAAGALAQKRVDRSLAALQVESPSLYLWKGAQVKRMVPGLEGFFADVYWLRTVQYFGGQRAFRGGRRYELLYPLIDITVALDPRMEIAYRYGAIFLSEPHPTGAGEPEKGISILERGTQALPANWRLRQDLGFFTFLFLHDAQKAARILTDAATIEGAPTWLKSLGGDILIKGGERPAARAMWTQMFRQAEEGPLKENARERLRELDALDRAEALTRLVAEVEGRRGARPTSLAELGPEARGPLVDPSGVPFEYDRSTGKVRISPRSTLWRPDHGE